VVKSPFKELNSTCKSGNLGKHAFNKAVPKFPFLEHAGELRIIILRRKKGNRSLYTTSSTDYIHACDRLEGDQELIY
jgi:hypothetical protein